MEATTYCEAFQRLSASAAMAADPRQKPPRGLDASNAALMAFVLSHTQLSEDEADLELRKLEVASTSLSIEFEGLLGLLRTFAVSEGDMLDRFMSHSLDCETIPQEVCVGVLRELLAERLPHQEPSSSSSSACDRGAHLRFQQGTRPLLTHCSHPATQPDRVTWSPLRRLLRWLMCHKSHPLARLTKHRRRQLTAQVVHHSPQWLHPPP